MFITLIPHPRRGQSTAFCVGLLAAAATVANPQGPDVVSGAVSMANPTAQTLEITNSPAAIINWQSFDIGAGETTRFIQQNAASAVLNRVTTSNASDIFGNLVSNGRVFLINPTGILIGRDAMVDTAGLVMSTLDINDEDFKTGRLHFEGGPDSGFITNHGYIKTTAGGEIVLIAPQILNAPQEGNDHSALIESENGELILAAGYALTITSLDDPDISFDVQAPDNEVINLGRLLAKGGMVSVLAGTITHSGEINADSLGIDETGRVVLTASHRIETTADSAILARGADEAPGGEVVVRAVETADGPAASASLAGLIDVSGEQGGRATAEGATVTVTGEIEASGAAAGGAVHVLGDKVEIAGARISANAERGDAGEIRIGGDVQGQGEMRRATRTSVTAGSRLEADGVESGDGGSVVVWSDEHTEYRGETSARGGAVAGDGGFIEVSGKETLQFAGAADVGSPFGEAGTLLLDPRTIFVVPGVFVAPVDASTSTTDPTPFAGDRFGASGISTLSNGNILIVNQNADAAGLVDTGEVFLLDQFGTLIGSLSGNAANERLGSFGSFTATGGNRLFPSPNASNGALAKAGAVILFDIASGVEIGRTSGGSANELFGQSVNSIGANFIVRSHLADVSGNVDAGAVVTVSGATGLQLGRVSGASAGELFGQTVNYYSTGPNTFLVRASGADVAGNVDAGTTVLVSTLTGLELGRVSGGAAGDMFGATVDFYGVPTGTYMIRSPGADVGGLIDNGTAVLVNNTTGIESGRTSGLASNDGLGGSAAILRASGNYFLRVPNATVGGNAGAGSLVLASGATGARIGWVDGNSVNEFLSNNINTYFLGGSDVLLASPSHDNGGLADAGGVFVVADIDLGAGLIKRGETLGVSANEQFGSQGPVSVAYGTSFAVTSANADIGPNVDAGSVVLLNWADGTALGRVDGTSASEQLGLFGILVRGNGNYFIPSPRADTGGGTIVDGGSVILADGLTGAALARFDGTTPSEEFGSDIDAYSIGFNDILVYAPFHSSNAGMVAQLAPVDLGSGNILRGGAAGAVPGDLVGNQFADFLPGGNYVIRAPSVEIGGNAGAGSVFVIDDATGGELLRVDGGLAGEGLGNNVDFPFYTDTFVVRSQFNGGNNNGAVFFIDGAGGTVLNTYTGNLDDEAGSEALMFAPNGNLIVPMPLADPNGVDSGAIALLDGVTFNFLGRTDGISANENFGDPGFIDTYSLCCTDFLVHSPLRSLSAPGSNEGAVVIVSGTAGTVLGAVSGLEPGDGLGEAGFAQVLGNGNYLLFNPSADTAGGAIVDAGAVVLVDAVNFQEMGGAGAGRFYGQSANEGLGSDYFAYERSNGNYFMRSRFAAPGGVANAGSLYLGSGVNGLRIGQANGDTINEFFSQSLDTSTLAYAGSNDILVRSAGGHGGGGTVVQVADADLGLGNIIRGRIDGTAGAGSAEALGSFSPTLAPDIAHYYVRSPYADPSGIVDAGSIYFVNIATGALSNRLDGLSANAFLGQSSPFTGSAGKLFVRSNGANNAGRLILADSTGMQLGEFSGNNTNELFGSSWQTVGNDIWVFAPLHNNGAAIAAGGIFAISNTDLGGGNIVRASLLGGAAGDNLGSLGANFVSGGNAFIRVPLADVGGVSDAGTAILVNSSLTALGRTNGTSANELFSQQFFSGVTGGNFLFRSPLADINGLTDAGTVKLVSGTTGTLIGETPGTSANEQFGGGSQISLINNGIAFTSQNADVGGLTDAGAIVQIDPTTGLEIQRVVGISANERLGAFGQYTLNAGRLLFPSPDADVNGIVDAGRLVFFDPSGVAQGMITDLLFADTPGADSQLTIGAIENVLAGGGTLILQANQDIIFEPGATLVAAMGNLVLQAGRSVIFNAGSPGSTIFVNNLTIVANETEANGVDPLFRGTGSGDVIIDTSQLAGAGTVSISGQTVQLVGGNTADSIFAPMDSVGLFESFLLDPAGFAPPASFVLGVTNLNVVADNVLLSGGDSPGAFAALASFGEFTVDTANIELTPGPAAGAHALFLGLGGTGEFTSDTCVGCGDLLLLGDPFLDPTPVSGFFVSGYVPEPTGDESLSIPTIDAILSNLKRGENAGETEEDNEDEEDDVKECGA